MDILIAIAVTIFKTLFLAVLVEAGLYILSPLWLMTEGTPMEEIAPAALTFLLGWGIAFLFKVNLLAVFGLAGAAATIVSGTIIGRVGGYIYYLLSTRTTSPSDVLLASLLADLENDAQQDK